MSLKEYKPGLRGLLDHFRRLALGANEQHAAAVCNNIAHSLHGLSQTDQKKVRRMFCLLYLMTQDMVISDVMAVRSKLRTLTILQITVFCITTCILLHFAHQRDHAF